MVSADAILKLVKAMNPIEVHNRLMKASDRNIALALLYLENDERNRILSCLSAGKARRVRDELALNERRRIAGQHYRLAYEDVLQFLRQQNKKESLKSYVRPKRT